MTSVGLGQCHCFRDFFGCYVGQAPRQILVCAAQRANGTNDVSGSALTSQWLGEWGPAGPLAAGIDAGRLCLFWVLQRGLSAL